MPLFTYLPVLFLKLLCTSLMVPLSPQGSPPVHTENSRVNIWTIQKITKAYSCDMTEHSVDEDTAVEVVGIEQLITQFAWVPL
jgi:hypothetical protein